MRYTFEYPDEENKDIKKDKLQSSQKGNARFTFEYPDEAEQQTQQLDRLLPREEEQFREQAPEQEQLQEESYPAAALRNVTSFASNVASGLGGVPRNIADLIQGIRKSSGEYAAQKLLPEELQEEARQAREETPGQQALNLLQKSLPQEETIKESIGSVLPENYLEPKSESEESFQEFGRDLGAALFPIGGPLKLAQVASAAASHGLGNIGKYLVRKVGGSEKAADRVKLGTVLITSLGLAPSLKKQATKIYKKADDLIKGKPTLPARPVRDIGNKIYNEYKGAGEGLYKPLAELENIATGNKTEIKHLVNFKKQLGSKISSLPRSEQHLKEPFSKLSREINNYIKNSPSSPKQLASYLKDGDEIWSGIAKSKETLNFIKDKAELGPLSAYLLGAAGVGKAGLAAAGVGAGYLGGTSYNVWRSLKSPAVRKAYFNMVKSAAQSSAPALIREAPKLEGALRKYISSTE